MCQGGPPTSFGLRRDRRDWRSFHSAHLRALPLAKLLVVEQWGSIPIHHKQKAPHFREGLFAYVEVEGLMSLRSIVYVPPLVGLRLEPGPNP